jgi:hypothetical protein
MVIGVLEGPADSSFKVEALASLQDHTAPHRNSLQTSYYFRDSFKSNTCV